MFQATRNGKQANVEQMATLVRMLGGTPDERGGIRKAWATTQAGIASRFGTTKTLQAMRAAETELITQYSGAVGRVDGLAKRALRKSTGRALIHVHCWTAHVANGPASEAGSRGCYRERLDEYFAG
jgi:hypothetical protein